MRWPCGFARSASGAIPTARSAVSIQPSPHSSTTRSSVDSTRLCRRPSAPKASTRHGLAVPACRHSPHSLQPERSDHHGPPPPGPAPLCLGHPRRDLPHRRHDGRGHRRARGAHPPTGSGLRMGSRRDCAGGLHQRFPLWPGVAASTQVQTLLHLYLLWGVVVGVGTGSTALVLSATVVNRWFTTQRGLALGLLGAASSTGRLVFLPLLATIVATLGWQAVGWVVAGCLLLVVLPLVALLMRDAPAAMGLTPYGTVHDPVSGLPPTAAPPAAPLVSLGVAIRQGNFWRLWLTFAICGATTNGLIGTHLIPHAIDQGLSAVAAATTLAMMGLLDIVGTLGSGWLSDRYDKRVPLSGDYGLRGLSLLFLPYADNLTKLALFGVVYGLDWIATVPPTVGLASNLFGPRSGPMLFGWADVGTHFLK